ncbi:MAG: hypothetical protein ACRDZX_13395 [Acidimicrobiales bacterium]
MLKQARLRQARLKQARLRQIPQGAPPRQRRHADGHEPRRPGGRCRGPPRPAQSA